VVAVDSVDLKVAPGEVIALVGENGAGKSTLMNVLSGIYPPEAGRIVWDGQAVTVPDVRAGHRLGIAHIHQELMLAPNLDVAGNIFLGREHCRPVSFTLKRKDMATEAIKHLERIGVTNIAPNTRTETLTTGQRQMVEIARALSLDAKLVIMDEPTSSLTLTETEFLYEVIRELKRQDIAVVYISHRLDEVFAVTDRVVVLRDGKRVASFKTSETNHDEIVTAMVGRDLEHWHPAHNYAQGDVLLEVDSLVTEDASGPNSFKVHRGEILGFSGLVGAGRSEIMQALFGEAAVRSGTIRLKGEVYHPRSPQSAIDAGIFLVPEDRKLHGLILAMSVQENVSLPGIKNYSRFKRLVRSRERQVAATEIARMRIRTPSALQAVGNLSGGNQQKVAIGKWLALHPTVLILDEPTRGIDVGAKAEIYDHMVTLAAEGLGIIMVSSDMEEILGMSDRVAVMHEGRIMGILDDKTMITEEHIMTLATGRRLAS
jgi:ribose transport system ATP-binding protein